MGIIFLLIDVKVAVVLFFCMVNLNLTPLKNDLLLCE